MADQTERVLLELKLNATQLKGELGTVRADTKALRDENRKLQNDLATLASVGAKGTAEYKKLLEELGANERQIISLGREAQLLNKNLDAVESTAGSFNKLAAETAFLEKQLKASTVGVNITAEAYDDLAARVNAGFQAQRDFARNISNNNRELVGSYAESLNPALEGVTNAVTAADNSIQALRERLVALKAQRDPLDPATDSARKLTAEIEKTKAGIKAAEAVIDDLGPSATVAADSLTGLRKKLAELEQTRETLNPTTKEAKDLNEEILGLQTTILQATGKVDEFGERVQKNLKKEQVDTVADAFGTITGAVNIATIAFGDNENATKAQVAAERALAIAQNVRLIQIGLASTLDAAAIVVSKTKAFFLRDVAKAEVEAAVATGANAAASAVAADAQAAEAVAAEAVAVAQAEAAAATAGATVAAEGQAAATVAQTAATEGATVAQQALNLVLKLNPIGLIIIAVAALVGIFAIFRNASESTKKKILDFAEAVLRFGTPIGLAITLVQKLYEKFEIVRTVLDPVLNLFGSIFTSIKNGATSLGQSLGLLDTAAEAAIAAQKKLIEANAETIKSYELQAKGLELAGAKMADFRAKERAGLVLNYNLERDLKTDLLARRAELAAAGDKLSEKELKALGEQANKVRELANQIAAFDQQTAQLALDLEKKQLANGSAILDARLALVRTGSAEELSIQKQKLANVRATELAELRLTADDKLAIEARYRSALRVLDREYNQQQTATRLAVRASTIETRLETVRVGSAAELALLKQQNATARAQELNDLNLTRAEKAAINAKYRAAEIKLDADFARANQVAQLEASRAFLNQQLADVGKNSFDEYLIRKQLIEAEAQLELAALDRRRNNSAKELEIQTATKEKLKALDLQFAAEANARRQQQYDAEASGYNSNAAAQLAGLDEGQRALVEASDKYAKERIKAIFANRDAEVVAAEQARDAQLAAAGTDSAEKQRILEEYREKKRVIEQNAATDTLNLEAETAAKQKALIGARYAEVVSIVQNALGTLSTLIDAQLNSDLAAQQSAKDAEVKAAGNNAEQKTAIEEKYQRQKERAEKEAAEKRRKLAIVQALINGALAVTEILRSPTAPFIEPFATVVRAVQIGLVVASTAAQVAAISSQKFAAGGVVDGPSHAAGGIQLYHKTGAHLGEMQGGETILVDGVSRSPILRSLASTLNVLAGGRSFAGSIADVAHYAAGGVVRYDPAALAGGRSGGAQASAGFDVVALVGGIVAGFNEAVANLPAPVVSVQQFREVENAVLVTEAKADN